MIQKIKINNKCSKCDRYLIRSEENGYETCINKQCENYGLKSLPLTLKQKEMFDLVGDKKIKEILFGGSAGSAKSLGICLIMIRLCLEFDGIRIGLARNDLTLLKKNTISSFFEAGEILQQKIKRDFKYNSMEGKITFNNGSVIQFYELKYLPSDPEYTRLGGALLTTGFIDEVGEVDEKGYNIFKTRLNRWKNDRLKSNYTGKYGIRGQLFMTCNPVKGWLYNEFYKKDKEGTLEPYKRFIPALPTDNQFISEDYLNNLFNLPETEKQRLLYGNWDYDDNPYSLINYNDIQNLYSNDNEYVNTNNQYYISSDIAFTSDNLVIMIWKGYELIEVYSENNHNDKPEELIKEFIKKYQVKYSNVIYDSDGVGKYLKNYLPNAIAMINNGTPFNKENYQNLKTQLAYKLAEMINDNKIRIRTDIHREQIEEELAFIQRVPSKDVEKLKILPKSDIKKHIGRSPDYTDAMIYRMYFEYKRSAIPTFTSF